MYSDEELLPISALQHLQFCERQCALIHIEQIWDENRLTAEGRILHDKVHEGGDETRGHVRIARGVRLRSLRLGLVGVADVVEFRLEQVDAKSVWRPFPVEYKRGKPKPDARDTVQLCAQAICLEEMLSMTIPGGALFYGQPRRRQEVAFDESLRRLVETTAGRLHALIKEGRTPSARYEKKCDNCSIAHLCMPKHAGQGRSAEGYLRYEISDLK